MIGKIYLTLLYWAVMLVLTMPFAAHSLQEVAGPFVGLIVASAVLTWLEKPWRRDYIYSNKRVRPFFMFLLPAAAVIITVGWSSWQFIFWLNA